MADTVRDAFRAELQAVMAAQAITWPMNDTLNSGTAPDPAVSYVTLEFISAPETPAWFAGPGANGWREYGIVNVVLMAASGTGTADAEAYARKIRDAFRNRRFTTVDGKSVRILSVSGLGGGQDERLGWSEAVALEYRVFNIG